MLHSGPGLWVVSQALLLLYFKMDNGSNVCGIEFNYNNKNQNEEEEKESIIGADQSDTEDDFTDQRLCKLIIGKFEVVSEKGRSVQLFSVKPIEPIW